MVSEPDDEIKERNLEHIAEISAHIEDDFLGTTAEEREEEREQYAEKTLDTPKAKSNGSKDKNKKVILLQRVSNAEYFAEAVLIDGVPKFLLANDGTGRISVVDSLPLEKEGKIAKPFGREAYINKPYSFSSKFEVEEYIKRARNETLDSIYRKIKSIWKKYIDADDFHISICAADTIFTFFQDKAGMTHYLFFVGGTGSGKSNNLELFHFLAYRNMTSSGLTAPNVYRYYGGREEGVGTICEDEADNIDEDLYKMKFYKNGYTTGKPVHRMDDNTDGGGAKVQGRYFTYGWKAFAAERLPDSIIAKGFLERSLEINCVYGTPQYDITEVANPMGDKSFEDLLKELEETRNLLLIYRILHHDDKFPDINLNITGREKQLFKPILRIFNITQTQNELESVISNYINKKRAANVDSLHAFLYRIVSALIKNANSYKLTSKSIWELVTSIPGEFLYKGNTKFESVDYGVLTQKKVNKILREVLGGEPDRDNSSRSLIFKEEKLARLDALYNLSLEVKVTQVTQVTQVTHSRNIGLEAY